MHFSKVPLIFVILLILLFACAEGMERESGYTKDKRENYADEDLAFEVIPEESTQDNDISQFISSSAAAVSDDSLRKIIRTGNMKFRVKDVRHSSIQIENYIQRFGGFVALTDLESRINKTEITPISADSSLETIYYTTYNDITFRVPVANLDTTLRTIALLIDFLDYRRIEARDITFSLLLNKMAEKRLGKHAGRIEKAIDEQGEKLRHTTAAEDALLSREEMLDRTKVRTLEIYDQIEYSTVNLHIYQRKEFKRTVIKNDKNISAYKPGMWSEIRTSLGTGWQILKSIILGLLSIWPLIILGAAGYFLYLKFFKNKA
jgi:hypothetical protein